MTLPHAEAERYRTWLAHARQLPDHLTSGTLVIEPLTVEELHKRDELMEQEGIGRGEAAALLLAMRDARQAIFVSSDQAACRVAQHLGLRYRTLPQIVEQWVTIHGPSRETFETLITGMRAARFGLQEPFLDIYELRSPNSDERRR